MFIHNSLKEEEKRDIKAIRRRVLKEAFRGFKNRYDFKEVLKDDFPFLGKGCFASVFKAGKYAVKIGSCEEDNYLDFLTFVINNPELEHLPKILLYEEFSFSFKKKEKGKERKKFFYLVILPIYEKVPRNAKIYELERFMIYKEKREIKISLALTLSSLEVVRRRMSKQNYNIISDLHNGNVMVCKERKELVITDPWA